MPKREAADRREGRLLECAPFAVIVVDADATITWASETLGALTGFRPDEVVGTDIVDHLDLDWNPRGLDSFAAALASGPGLRRPMLFKVRCKDGSARVCRVSANPQVDDPDVAGLAVYVEPWGERDALDAVVDALAAGTPFPSVAAKLLAVCETENLEGHGALLTGQTRQLLDTRVCADRVPASLVVDDGEAGTPWRRAVESGVATWAPVGELPPALAAPAEKAGFEWCWAWPLPGVWPGCLVVFRGADEEPDHACRALLDRLANLARLALERNRAAEQLREAATHDPLTGLPNRPTFVERLGKVLQTPVGRRIGLIVFDLDGFRALNARLGHSSGDEVLSVVGRRLRNLFRGEDLIARYGADEFAAICTGVHDEGALRQIAARVTASVHEPITLGHERVEITAAVGTALGGRESTTVDALLDAADAALHHARDVGGPGWRVDEPLERWGEGFARRDT